MNFREIRRSFFLYGLFLVLVIGVAILFCLGMWS
jgi:hypothetical protein